MALKISQAKDLQKTTTRDLPKGKVTKNGKKFATLAKHGRKSRTKPTRKKRPSR